MLAGSGRVSSAGSGQAALGSGDRWILSWRSGLPLRFAGPEWTCPDQWVGREGCYRFREAGCSLHRRDRPGAFYPREWAQRGPVALLRDPQANPRLVFGSQNDCGLPRGGRIDHRHPCRGGALPPGERREGGNGAGEGWAALGWAGAALLVMAGLSWIVALSRYHGLSRVLRSPCVLGRGVVLTLETSVLRGALGAAVAQLRLAELPRRDLRARFVRGGDLLMMSKCREVMVLTSGDSNHGPAVVVTPDGRFAALAEHSSEKDQLFRLKVTSCSGRM